jgi:hypothetical protein
MKKFVIIIGMVLFVIQLPAICFAQEKKIELECGCEITPITRQCGICGGFLKCSQRYDNGMVFDYICSNYPACTHTHKNLRANDYFGHTHDEKVCLKRQSEIVNGTMMVVYITNRCPRNRSLGITSIISKSTQGEKEEKVYKQLKPQETFRSQTLFPKSDDLRVNILKD